MTQPLGDYPDHEPYDDETLDHVSDENYPVNDNQNPVTGQTDTYTRYSDQEKGVYAKDASQQFENARQYPSSTPYVQSGEERSYTSRTIPQQNRVTTEYTNPQIEEAHERGYIDYRDGGGHDASESGSNWPSFLKEKGNQLFFAIVSLMLTISLGAGIVLPIYYLFILDDSVEKDKASKIISWVAFIVPLVLFFLLFIVMLIATAMGMDASTPQLPYPYGKIH